jgi:thioester reductase-like protein
MSDATVAALTGTIDHFFHLAAVYDMTAKDEVNRVANVEGTRHAVELANAIAAGRFHHTSSIAAAGMHRGLFREDMFDEGQKLDHPYHRTKFEAEKMRALRRGCPGACTGRRSSWATRGPARWTRSTAPITSSPRSRWPGTTCPAGFR